MSYQLYRNTTLGHTLQESLDELIQCGQITPQLALKVLLQFDKAINTALANRVKNRIQLKGKLNTYRFCDNVWTFVLNNVDFRDVQELAKCDKVKIVACDGKSKYTHKGGSWYLRAVPVKHIWDGEGVILVHSYPSIEANNEVLYP
ncbi:transcription initiation factor IIA subunit 2-like isoform X1 [Ostrea edulis]|uniref:transcription initiation factor IIA subunit 2-like isoform X1 n=1 Tax=Ostrea edulis TaxID=37623 RepID=UPI0024AF8D6D|nr:transcription initiation factor IIA subunit 2-like isoform X1 [Ostrea edulis]